MSDQTGDTTPQDQGQEQASAEQTPPAGQGEGTPSKTEGETVPLKKEEYERLQSDLKQARDLQSIADKAKRAEKIKRIAAEKMLKQYQENGGNAGEGNQPPAPSVDSTEERLVKAQAEKEITALIWQNQDYQKVLAADETLKGIIATNPLALIGEFIDAEDAAEQIKNLLDNRVAKLNVSASGAPAANGGGDGKDIQAPGGAVEMKGNITPEVAAAMSANEWEKLPVEQREKMLGGDF